MNAIFLDYASVSADGDLDTSRLTRCLPALDFRPRSDPDAIGQLITGKQVVLLNKVQVGAELIAATPALRLICVSATGTNNIDLEAAERARVAVCNVRDYCTASVVEHVIGTLLLLSHQLREYDSLVHSGAWQSGDQFCLLRFPIRELAGLSIGIVGYGTLGAAVAHAAEAFGMRVLVANRPGGDRVAGRIDLHDLLPQVDVLSLHCPLTPATTGLIGAQELALMKNDAIVINTARGALVDSEALTRALRGRQLGGASIDVLPEEPPLHGDPLLAGDIPRLIVTPHIAWAAREARQRCLDEMAANVEDFLRGGRRGRVV